MTKPLKHFKYTLFWLGATMACQGQSYFSPDSSYSLPRLYWSAGLYFPEVTTALRIDSKLGIGSDISLEDDFKLNSNMSVFRSQLLFQLKERSQLAVGFTNLRRGREIALQQDFTIGDTVFYAGARAGIDFNVYYYALSWRYSLLTAPGWQAGFSLGMRLLQFKTRVEAQLNQRRNYFTNASMSAPALLLGGHIGGYLTPRLLGRYSLEFFRISIGDIKVKVLETEVSLQYFLLKNWALGAAYATNNYQVRELPFSDSFKGKVLFSFDGLQLFLSGRF